ncbi:MAG: hypothetical protein ACRCXT_08835 [Paraclostridium sp.]
MREEISEFDNTNEINDALDSNEVVEEVLDNVYEDISVEYFDDEYDDIAIEEDFYNEYDDNSEKGLGSEAKLVLLFVGAGLCGILFSGVLLKFINWIIFN